MSTITEKLDKLNTIKKDIKQTLISKGLEPTDNFESYVEMIQNLGNDVEDSFTMEETSTVMPTRPTMYKTITYNGRTFKANTYAALCLPFDINLDDLKSAFGDGYIIQTFNPPYQFTDTENALLNIGTLSYGTHNLKYYCNIKAFTPFLIYPTNEVVNPVFHNKIIDPNVEKNNILYQSIKDGTTGDLLVIKPTVDSDVINQWDFYITGSGSMGIRTSATSTTIKGWRFVITPLENFKSSVESGYRLITKSLELPKD